MSPALRTFHRLLGAYAALGLLWLALTGALLQGAALWHWDRVPLPAPLQSRLYGVSAAAPAALVTDSHRLEGTPSRWQFDSVAIQSPPGRPLALAHAGDTWLAIGETGLVMLDAAGQELERQSWPTLGIDRVSRMSVGDHGEVCLQGGGDATRCTIDGLDWHSKPSQAPQWAALQPAPAAGDQAAPQPITWERLFQDLHALRFVGPAAGYIGLSFALAMSALAITGLWTYWRLSRLRRRHAGVNRGRGWRRHPHR